VSALIEAAGLHAYYGTSHVLHGVDFDIQAGETIGLMGRNGMGKTTLLTTLMGFTRVLAGAIHWRGQDLARVPPFRRARGGIGWVPQERHVFPSLTVDEHLQAVARPGHWNLRRVYALLPRLEERRRNFGNQLSGGEQQMLAIGRALMINPQMLLLDEPMEGLAPIIVQELVRAIRGLIDQGALTVIIVEQHARLALGITREAIVLERGRIVHQAASAALLADAATLDRLMSVA
jgi:branched-chain amino acid transport system ATP-binding protein